MAQWLKSEQRKCLKYGAPGEIRTPGLLVRSQALYPTELRAQRTKLRAGITECHNTGRFRGANITTSFGGHHSPGQFRLSANKISPLDLLDLHISESAGCRRKEDSVKYAA
jgi:hypothetical protein